MMQGDGKGIAMRPEHRKGAGKETGAAHPGVKKMAEIVAVADFTPAVREPEDIAAPPARRKAHPGPVARDKWVSASITESIEDMIAAAFDEADRRDPQRVRQRVFLVDGNKQQITAIEAQAAERSLKVPVFIDYIHVIIDIIHVLEYLWGAAWSLHEAGDPAAEDWVAVKALAVLAGDSARAAAEITAAADAAGLQGSQRTGADACVRYLGNKHDYLRYDQALAAGWPIATGVIEGACRHLIADRLDIGGARWGLDGAEAILTLRAVISNGDFEEYWRFHLEREHQRLYPGIKQGQYALGA